MKTVKILFVLTKRYLQRYYKYLLLLVVLLVIFYLVFPIVYGKIYKERISEGVIGTYTEDSLPEVVTNLLSDGLVVLDNKGLPQPELVESWKVNSDAKEYTLKLKDNIYWIDGSKISAKDIEVIIPDVKFSALDDRTLKLTLADSFSPLPTLLTKPIVKKGTNIGTGPYEITSVEKNQVFVNKITLTSSKKDLPQVVIRFYPNENIALDALRKGEIQSVFGINDPSSMENEKPFALISKNNFNKLVTIFYNTQDAILSDRNFRLALSFAAPSIKDEIEAKTPIPPNSWAFNPEVKDFLDNPTQAKTYLDRVQKGKESTIVLTSTETLKNLGSQIVTEWNNQGIRAVLRVESGIPQNFQALLISQSIPADPDQYSLWHSTQAGSNISKYSSPSQYSPRVDKDLEDGRKAIDIKVREEKYKDFQRVLVDDAPATFLYFPKYNIVYLKKVEGNLKKIIDLQLPQFK